MKPRCRHDIKIKVLFELFRPMTKKSIAKKSRLKSRKLNRILKEFKEKKLIQELNKKDGTTLYRTTPKGRKLVKHFRDIMEHLEEEKVLPHIFGSHRYR
jgi:predicted transcriptional regulator